MALGVVTIFLPYSLFSSSEYDLRMLVQNEKDACYSNDLTIMWVGDPTISFRGVAEIADSMVDIEEADLVRLDFPVHR